MLFSIAIPCNVINKNLEMLHSFGLFVSHDTIKRSVLSFIDSIYKYMNAYYYKIFI